jgi:hypothetical protein
MNELSTLTGFGLAIGFIFGVVLGSLFFELCSVKHPKTREEAEQLLNLLPPIKETKHYDTPIIEGWMEKNK